MKKYIVRLFILNPFIFLRNIYFYFFNFIVLKINNVKYSSFPIINGKLIIINRGVFLLGNKIKFNSSIYSNFVGLYKPCTVEISKNAVLKIGNFCGFSGVSIVCSESITIGEYLFCGGNVSIWDTDFHPLNFEKRKIGVEGTKIKSIFIGNNVFIGANSIILKGVTIGDRSIIGAGSVVTKSIPEDEIWAGNPARKISKNKINE
jgi:acetyltransferase-like isoleucine patch superfamily enzyme